MGLGRLPGGVEPVGAEADAADRVGEADGVQLPGPAADHDLPDPAPGFQQVDGVARAYGIVARVLHTLSVGAAEDGRK